MKICKLKNDSKVPMSIVVTTRMNIDALAGSGDLQQVMVRYELGKKALDAAHKIWSPEIEVLLKNYSLLQSDGTMHDYVRNIVQSTISFDAEDMPVMGDPVIAIFEE